MSKIVRGNPWQHGWSFGYETETYRYLFGLSTAIWGNFEDRSFEQDTHHSYRLEYPRIWFFRTPQATCWCLGVPENGSQVFLKLVRFFIGASRTSGTFRPSGNTAMRAQLDEHRVRLGLAMV